MPSALNAQSMRVIAADCAHDERFGSTHQPEHEPWAIADVYNVETDIITEND